MIPLAPAAVILAHVRTAPDILPVAEILQLDATLPAVDLLEPLIAPACDIAALTPVPVQTAIPVDPLV